MAGWAVSRNGGGGGGFVGPVRRAPVQRVVQAARTVTSSRPVTVAPRDQFVSHYDPSRVVDLDKLKVVKDMRSMPEFGEERGDTQGGDNGVMSPSESRSGTIAAGGGVPGKNGTPGTATKNNLVPLALLIAGAILLGG